MSFFVRFERTVAPTGFVQFTRNPRIGSQDTVELKQPMDWSNGNVLYSYNKGIVQYEFLLDWRGMSDADYQNLLNFHLYIAVGKSNPFTYTDMFGTQFTCIILTDKINFPYIAVGRRAGQLLLLKV